LGYVIKRVGDFTGWRGGQARRNGIKGLWDGTHLRQRLQWVGVYAGNTLPELIARHVLSQPTFADCFDKGK
jgi:hypothetical protein